MRSTRLTPPPERARRLDEASLRTSGLVRLDPSVSRERALEHLAAAGLTGTVTVVGDTVTVRVTTTRPLTVLGFTGLRPLTIHAEGSAHAVSGIRGGGS